VRDVQTSRDLGQDYEKSLLSGRPDEEQVARAREHVKALFKAWHLGGLARLLQDADNLSPANRAIIREIQSQPSEQPEAAVYAPLFLFVAARSRSPLLRQFAAKWVEGHYRWVLEFVVWKTNGKYKAIVLGNPGPKTDHTAAQLFFSDHGLRVEPAFSQLSIWAKRMQFFIPQRLAQDVRTLAEDLGLASKYFKQAAEEAPPWPLLPSIWPGSSFPRGKDEQLLHELGKRFKEFDLPASLMCLLEDSQA
jgi:hypothetical protein